MEEPRSLPPQRDLSRREKNTKAKNKSKIKASMKWAFWIFIISFVITGALSLISSEVIDLLPVSASFIVLVIFVLIGIIFDMIGLAVATVDPTPFNSMASRRLLTGKKAVYLISNTEKVSSVCNDVIGDISGVMSGANSAAIAAHLFSDGIFWFSLMMTSLSAAIIVGGKAMGKVFAIKKNEQIVYVVAKILCGFKK